MGESQGEDDADGGRFDYWAKGIIKVYARLLSETTDNAAGFVASERPIEIIFVAKDPFAAENISTWGRRDKSPGVVSHEGIIFFLHSETPRSVTESGEVVVRYGRGDNG